MIVNIWISQTDSLDVADSLDCNWFTWCKLWLIRLSSEWRHHSRQ